MSQDQTTSGLEELERVREILFGSMARDQDKRIQQLQNEIARLQQAVTQLNGQLAEQNRQHIDQIGQLRQQTDAANASLRGDMEHALNQLRDDKLDRRMLGDLLTSLGRRLQEDSAA
ncbi:hypothetical protein GC175_21260 [bacterium]|nr:hypothetical protein [bacterium]